MREGKEKEKKTEGEKKTQITSFKNEKEDITMDHTLTQRMNRKYNFDTVLQEMYILVFIPSSWREVLKHFSFSLPILSQSLFLTSICPNPRLVPEPF